VETLASPLRHLPVSFYLFASPEGNLNSAVWIHHKFGAIHFRGSRIRPVSCYTLIADADFHGHSPAV